MVDLLSCPFCGAAEPKLHTNLAAAMSWVSCASCGLQAPTETGITDEQAVAYWNRRTRTGAGASAAWDVLGEAMSQGDYSRSAFERIEAALRPCLSPVAVEGGDAEAGEPLGADDVEWVVNDIAELGVKIGEQFFFLYKGYSLVYGALDPNPENPPVHDDGTPMHWRPVFKREFGECAHPVNYKDPSRIGTVSLEDSDEWKPLPAACLSTRPAPSTPSPQIGEAGAGPVGEPVACERCQGNGEIVTDWQRYKHPHDGDVGDEAVTGCPDCSGEGTLSVEDTTMLGAK